MTENNQNQDKLPTAEAPQQAAHTSDAKAEAAGTPSDELSGDDLEAVTGGIYKMGAHQTADL